jgi:mono/diheme cytochrome c family protein
MRMACAALCLAAMFFVQPAAAEKIDLTKALKGAGLPTVTVSVDDPVYKRKMRFEGYRLADALRKLVPALPRFQASGAELVLRAADGYSPSMSLTLALSRNGIIAFRDLSRPENDPFEKVAQGKKTVSPAPYYLVWPDVDPKDTKFKWPYQLVEIEVKSYADHFGEAVPRDTRGARGKRAERGFALFREHCIQCHSVNLVGGKLGPELNVPKNITEYWLPDILPDFIKNASAYRARSQMPPFENLSQQQVQDILYYLDVKRGEKVCGSAQKPC